MGIIYLARNKDNGKGYVGQTTKTLKERKRGHVKDSLRRTTCFAKALNKYGVDGFDWYILCRVEKDRLYTVEKQWIAALNTMRPSGYNLADAGPGRSGYSLPDEAKAKMSAARKGKPMAEETKRKIAETQKGRKFSTEHREKLRTAALGRKISPEELARLKTLNVGRKRSAESRAKQSAAMKGRRVGGPVSAESRAKISAAKKGVKHGPYSAEHRAKISAGLKKFYAQPIT